MDDRDDIDLPRPPKPSRRVKVRIVGREERGSWRLGDTPPTVWQCAPEDYDPDCTCPTCLE
jgi:hypothetical protein